jgi:hypothetical protein
MSLIGSWVRSPPPLPKVPLSPLPLPPEAHGFGPKRPMFWPQVGPNFLPTLARLSLVEGEALRTFMWRCIDRISNDALSGKGILSARCSADLRERPFQI